MNEFAEALDWTSLREFAGVDLSQSFVLSWQVESETLLVDVDLFLTPDHPFYEAPRPNEKVCIRPAIIEFPYCAALKVEGVASDEPATAAAAIPHGAMNGLKLTADGCYAICGDFGTVTVDAERPVLRLENRRWRSR